MDDNQKTGNRRKKIVVVIMFFAIFCIMLVLYKYYGDGEYNVVKNEVKDTLDYNSENDEINETLQKVIHLEICLDDVMDIVDLEERSSDAKDTISKDDTLDNSEEHIDIPIVPVLPPDLTGLDEETAISMCKQNGYTYSIEYYLGGNGTVISQSPTASENIDSGGNISISIGVSQSEFSNKLLGLINQKRSSLGLEQLVFSEQLNYACNILAQENVNSVDCIRPDGSHWSSVIWENGIALNDGTFTTRNNITSLTNANSRIKYAGNSYGDGNLLTPSYNIIGMAYSSNNMLVIIIGY